MRKAYTYILMSLPGIMGILSYLFNPIFVKEYIIVSICVFTLNIITCFIGYLLITKSKHSANKKTCATYEIIAPIIDLIFNVTILLFAFHFWLILCSIFGTAPMLPSG